MPAATLVSVSRKRPPSSNIRSEKRETNMPSSILGTGAMYTVYFESGREDFAISMKPSIARSPQQ